ncbi:MAG TPA: autotransporter-associated beta strand repeat-containing protein [Chthoniobacterales bacterium]
MRKLRPILIALLMASPLVAPGFTALAGSATWKTAPTDGLWNNTNNWAPATVPQGSDTATFGTSSITSISETLGLSSIGAYQFNAGASAYTITYFPGASFAINGTGVTNSSGVLQNFVLPTTSTGDTIVSFLNGATAGDLTQWTVSGSTDSNHGAQIVFANTSKAANTTLIANSGTGLPGAILFTESATGDSASVTLNGGLLDISGHDSTGMTLGSLEGSGPVFLGSHRLTVGRNRANTTYTGLIQDGGMSGGTGGSFAKVGLGTLTITNANTYTGDTSVNGGTFTVANTTGSATGTGPVQVNAGILGGKGTIAGAVNVGADTPDRPHLAPASGTQTPATLTIQSSLTFQPTGGYNWSVRAKGRRSQSDRVNANGVTILSGASFTILSQVQGTLTVGTVFTVISNTSAMPISGTFSNLANGAVITIGSNNLQANYSGGDGNDLTLTVVP